MHRRLSGFADPIGTSSRVVKQGGALGGRVTLREPFERVEQHVVGKRYLIDREVALEHAPVRGELLDTVAHDRSDGRGQLFGTDRPRPGMPVEPQPRHSEPAQLTLHVCAFRHGCDTLPPRRYHFVVLVGVRFDPRQPAKVVRMMVRSGKALAKVANSGNWGKQTP